MVVPLFYCKENFDNISMQQNSPGGCARTREVDAAKSVQYSFGVGIKCVFAVFLQRESVVKTQFVL